MASVSPARDESAGYVAWGHSKVVNPWGEVVGKADAGEETIFVDIDLVILVHRQKQTCSKIMGVLVMESFWVGKGQKFLFGFV